MDKNRVIQAPNPVEDFWQTIFLAGSIEMGLPEDWQSRATDYLLKNTSYTILNPRRDDWDSSWEQSIDDPQFFEQVSWELDCLEKCTAILMYFSPETKAPISLLEFGLFCDDDRPIYVVCPDGFWKKGNVEIVCGRYGIPLDLSLESALKEIAAD